MSLLDHGPHPILVYPSVWAADPDDNYAWRRSDSAVLVWARVQPISSTELLVNGQQVVTVARVIARQAPVGPWDRVEYDSRTWDVLGEPEHRQDSPTTSHVTAIIQARGARRDGQG